MFSQWSESQGLSLNGMVEWIDCAVFETQLSIFTLKPAVGISGIATIAWPADPMPGPVC
jgi:hypothetical protein